MSEVPELIVSGESNYSIETAKIYGDSTLCMYDSFIKAPNRFNVTKRTMISVAVVISNDKESALEIIKSSNSENAANWTIYGNEEDIKSELTKLKNLGVTDVLISNPFALQDSMKIHSFIKSIEI
jgi:hypothetical protein